MPKLLRNFKRAKPLPSIEFDDNDDVKVDQVDPARNDR